MNNEPTLFDRGREKTEGTGVARARTSDPQTSREAASSMRGRPASQLETLVLKQLQAMGTGTSEEVADALGISLQSISPRFAPLDRRGWIVKTDEKRAGSSGRQRQVWRVAP